MPSVKISYKDVLEFFEESTPEMSELVLGLVQDRMAERESRRAKISANLKKARAAKGKGGEKDEVTSGSVKADPATQADANADLDQAQTARPVQARRPARVSESHTANVNEALSQTAGQ